MALLSRKKQLAAKIEAVAGTAETLNATYADILAEDVRFNFNPTPVTRNPLRSSISPLASVAGPRLAEITCRVELKGSGTATTEPSWGRLLEACGYAKTVASTYIDYQLTSVAASTKHLTMAVYNDGVCGKMYGALGTVSIDCDANAYCFLNFTFTGIYHSRADAAMLTGISFESTLPQVFYNAGLTFNFGTAYASAVFDTMNINTNNTVVVRDDANATNGLTIARITARDPQITMAPDTELVATIDWESLITTPTLGTLAFDIGSTTGNKISIYAPQAQCLGWTDADRDDVSTDSLTFGLRASSGDDELRIRHG